jgi:TatD DNase family protein
MYISFSGIVTFRGKRSDPLRQALHQVPRDRLLIETDCPYLAPDPVRGKRNEPAFVAHTARFVAGQLGLDPGELAEITTRNTRQVFRLDRSRAGQTRP